MEFFNTKEYRVYINHNIDIILLISKKIKYKKIIEKLKIFETLDNCKPVAIKKFLKDNFGQLTIIRHNNLIQIV
jgi:hypothetical protein